MDIPPESRREAYLNAVERRGRIAERRGHRFLGEDGIVARSERSGDEWIEAGEFAQELADTVPGLSSEVVLRRVVRAAKRGEFGLRHLPDRDVVTDLIDLAGWKYEPGQYALRPSTFMVELRPATMRARRSTWARWIARQGWTVPAFFSHNVVDTAARLPTYATGAATGQGAASAAAAALPGANPGAAGGQAPRLRRAYEGEIRNGFDELNEWINMLGGPVPDKWMAIRMVSRLLAGRHLYPDPIEIQNIADEPRYASGRRGRGRPPRR